MKKLKEDEPKNTMKTETFQIKKAVYRPGKGKLNKRKINLQSIRHIAETNN